MSMPPDFKDGSVTISKQAKVEQIALRLGKQYGLSVPVIKVADNEDFTGIAAGHCRIKDGYYELVIKDKYEEDQDTVLHEVCHALHLANNTELSSGQKVYEDMVARIENKNECRIGIVGTYGKLAVIRFCAEVTAEYFGSKASPSNMYKENDLDTLGISTMFYEMWNRAMNAMNHIPNNLKNVGLDKEGLDKSIGKLMSVVGVADFLGGHIGGILAVHSRKINNERAFFTTNPNNMLFAFIEAYSDAKDSEDFEQRLVNSFNKIK